MDGRTTERSLLTVGRYQFLTTTQLNMTGSRETVSRLAKLHSEFERHLAAAGRPAMSRNSVVFPESAGTPNLLARRTNGSLSHAANDQESTVGNTVARNVRREADTTDHGLLTAIWRADYRRLSIE